MQIQSLIFLLSALTTVCALGDDSSSSPSSSSGGSSLHVTGGSDHRMDPAAANVSSKASTVSMPYIPTSDAVVGTNPPQSGSGIIIKSGATDSMSRVESNNGMGREMNQITNLGDRPIAVQQPAYRTTSAQSDQAGSRVYGDAHAADPQLDRPQQHNSGTSNDVGLQRAVAKLLADIQALKQDSSQQTEPLAPRDLADNSIQDLAAMAEAASPDSFLEDESVDPTLLLYEKRATPTQTPSTVPSTTTQSNPAPGSGPFVIPLLVAPGLNGSSTVLTAPHQKRDDDNMGMQAFNLAQNSAAQTIINERQKNSSITITPTTIKSQEHGSKNASVGDTRGSKSVHNSAASLSVGAGLVGVLVVAMYL